MGTFLIVDQDRSFCADTCQYFGNIGHSMFQAQDYPAALSEIKQRGFDVVIANVKIPGGTVHDLIREVKEKNKDTAVIVHADLDAIQEGIKAMQEGAFSIVQKPFSIPELNYQIKRALDKSSQKGQPPSPLGPSHELYQPYNFIGESLEIKKVFRIVNRVAKTNSSVIILGETGTGKELVAGAIHYNSLRADGPFVRVNCAALPEQLLESELFGYDRGAFTGADRARVGRFEHANGGTIFLDEVADMSLFTQAKVLRVLQEKEFERLGSNETRKTDVRIISATNRDLMDRMAKGLFREDLFYRLNVVTIRLPPLREREGDLGLLIEFFLKRAAGQMNKKVRSVEPDAMRKLTRYRWPGNIRELENAMERAVLLAEGDTITVDDLHLFFSEQVPRQEEGQGVQLPAQGIRLEDAERSLIEQALERSSWVQKDAARLLGVSSRALNYKIKTYGLTHPRWRQNR